MKMLFIIVSLSLNILLTIATSAFASEQTFTEWPAQKDVPENKIWSVKFNEPVLKSTVNDQNIYVMDNNGQKQNIEVTLAADSKTVQVTPLENYKSGNNYTLYISHTISPISSQTYLKNNIKMQFRVIQSIKTGYGSIKGCISWQYNSYITKADVGASIALIPKNLDKTLDNYYFTIKLQQAFQGENGIYTSKVDEYGNYQIGDIPIGEYYLLIFSNKTYSDMKIDLCDKQQLLKVFSEKDWSNLEVQLQLKNYELQNIEIKNNKTFEMNYNFGFGYILIA